MNGTPAHHRPTTAPTGLMHAFGLVVALLIVLPATAQERFRLGDDDRWKIEETVDPNSPEGELAEAWKALADEQYGRAIDLADDWIDQYPQHPLFPEALLLRGDAHNARGDEFTALFDYEAIARLYPGSDVFVTALERELDIAKDYARGKKRRALGFRVVDARSEAQELMIRIQERLPESRLGEEAHFELANFYFRARQMSLAVDAYDLFLLNYPMSEMASVARRRLIYAHLASFKGPEFDPSGLIEASTRINELKQIEPAVDAEADALLVRIEESTAQKLFETARWYDRTGDPITAEYTLRRLVREHPQSIATGAALDKMPDLLRRLPPSIRRQAAAAGVYPSELFEPYGLAPVLLDSTSADAPRDVPTTQGATP
ncbi:MAG: outer membrane protein assembly factor BamD [Planctomycetota bacterium]